MRNAWPRWILLSVALWYVGCAGCPSTPAPPAQTPVLESVFKPDPTLTNVGIDPAGAFQVLPSSSVIVWFRSPVTQSIEVAVNGVVIEQTSNVARQQTLESQGLGYWFHRAGSPNVNVSGDPRWDVAIAAPPPLRVSQGFTVTLTGTTSNTTTPRSSPLPVRIAIGPPDWVSIPFNPKNDSAVVLLDGKRTSGCADDEIWRGNDIINIGDMRARGNCNEEMIVFTKGNAVQLINKTITGIWTDSLRDFAAADANSGVWNVPVDVWLLQSGLMGTATDDFSHANQFYENSRCGISFAPNYHDVSGNSSAAILFGGGDVGSMQNQTWRNSITGSMFFTAGRINVYYTGIPFTNPVVNGFTAVPNRNIIGIAIGADNASLAHELGHSFSLEHSDGVAGIPSTNIMRTNVMTPRTEFTKGQCFRMNVNTKSTLNTNSVRTGFIRDCPDGTTSSTCPALSLDAP